MFSSLVSYKWNHNGLEQDPNLRLRKIAEKSYNRDPHDEWCWTNLLPKTFRMRFVPRNLRQPPLYALYNTLVHVPNDFWLATSVGSVGSVGTSNLNMKRST